MGENIWVVVVLGVLLVGMIIMTIIPQKKRQKQQQEMMNNLVVGAKIMTIGRIVGKIVAMNAADNTIVLNVGSDENPTLITIEKNGVGIVMDAVKPVPVDEVVPIPVEEAPAVKEEPVFEETKSAAPVAKKAAPAKKPAVKKEVKAEDKAE